MRTSSSSAVAADVFPPPAGHDSLAGHQAEGHVGVADVKREQHSPMIPPRRMPQLLSLGCRPDGNGIAEPRWVVGRYLAGFTPARYPAKTRPASDEDEKPILT